MNISLKNSKNLAKGCIASFKRMVAEMPERMDEDWNVDDPAGLLQVIWEVQSAAESMLSACPKDVGNLLHGLVQRCAEDIELRSSLDELEDEWRKSLDAQSRALFNMDGFYPNYTRQKIKILFVGREACWMSGSCYTDVLAACFREGKIGDYTVAQYPFHRRQFYLAHGILAAARDDSECCLSLPEWESVPTVNDLRPRFGKDLSWAFVNISKLSNDTNNWQTDERRYRPFVSDPKNRALLKRQIEFLAPDIIIGAGVYDLIGIMGYDERTADRTNPACYYYEPTDFLPPFLDCYHFSAIKKDYEGFYKPVADVLSRHPFGKNVNRSSN